MSSALPYDAGRLAKRSAGILTSAIYGGAMPSHRVSDAQYQPVLQRLIEENSGEKMTEMRCALLRPEMEKIVERSVGMNSLCGIDLERLIEIDIRAALRRQAASYLRGYFGEKAEQAAEALPFDDLELRKAIAESKVTTGS